MTNTQWNSSTGADINNIADKGTQQMVRGPCAGVILIPVYIPDRIPVYVFLLHIYGSCISPGWPMLHPTRTSKAWWEVRISFLGWQFGTFSFPFNLCSCTACDVESQGGNFNILSLCIYETWNKLKSSLLCYGLRLTNCLNGALMFSSISERSNMTGHKLFPSLFGSGWTTKKEQLMFSH